MANPTWEFRYHEYADRELSWFPLDSLAAYEHHLATRRQDLEDNGWIGRSIIYRFNEHGFRSDPLVPGQGAMFLGCSFTFGTGLALEDCWPYQVSKRLALSCWNLGVAGAANDTMFRLGSFWIPHLAPRVVVVLLTEPTRLEIIDNRKFVPIMPKFIPKEYEQFYRYWVTTDANSRFNEMKNQLAIQSLCDKAGIPVFFFRMKDFMYKFDQPYLDYARDLTHPGPKTMARFADKVVSAIEATGYHSPDQ